MIPPKNNSGKKKSKVTKIIVLVFPSIVFGILGAFLLLYPPPDFKSGVWEIIPAVLFMSAITTLFGWAQIISGNSEKEKKKPKSDVEREQQEQQESIDRLKKHLEDKDKKERKKKYGF